MVRVHVGYGFIRVGSPVRRMITVVRKDGKLKRVQMAQNLLTEGYTGDWYKFIFRAHDTAKAFSRPWDFGISSFHMVQMKKDFFKSGKKREMA